MVLLEVSRLSVVYETRMGPLRALYGVSFSMERGEMLGLLGESGSGKTTIGRAIIRSLPANARITGGKVVFDGVDMLRLGEDELNRIRGGRITMIPQNAMNALSPVHRIGAQLADIVVHHQGLSRREALRVVEEKLKKANLNPSVTRMYPHELSGGMRQRVLIAMALLNDPELVIADEPTTGLDVIVQYQILRELRRLNEKYKLSMIMISHDVAAIARTCSKVVVLYGGRVFEYGGVVEVFKNPANPYTAMLLASHPEVRGPKRRIREIKGSPPNMLDLPTGCVFHPRCPYADKLCRVEEPPLVKVGQGHYSRCHYPLEGGEPHGGR